MKLAPKHIHSTQRPTVVLWEGRYITPHQLYQVGKYWWSLFQVNTTNINNKCLPAWFYQMNYCRIPNALQCLKSCCSILKTHFLFVVLFVCKSGAFESLEQSLMKKENRSHTAYYPPSHPVEAGLLYFYLILGVLIHCCSMMNNSERPIDTLAVKKSEKHILLTDWQLEIKRC